MKYVLGFILMIVASIAMLEYTPGLYHSAAIRPAVNYSPEFKAKAHAAIDAIERLQSFTGALPQYEARKAIDDLGLLADTYSEDNIIAVLSTYHRATRMMNVRGAKQDLAELNRVRRDISAIESTLR